LIARGESLGAMTFAWSRSGRKYSASDLPLIEDLGARAAVAVDNARLYQRERAAGQQLVFLAEASTTLASSLDVETTLTNVAHLVVPQFADWCAVDVLDEDGGIRRLAVAHRDPDKLEWSIHSRDEFPPTADEPEGTGRVVRTGEAVLYRTITPELLTATTSSAAHLETLMEARHGVGDGRAAESGRAHARRRCSSSRRIRADSTKTTTLGSRSTSAAARQRRWTTRSCTAAPTSGPAPRSHCHSWVTACSSWTRTA